MAVSIAGATRETHERIRVGSDFALALANVERLLALRSWRRSAKPKVEIFFLMTQANMGELPRAVATAASLGADELVATNLDYVVTPEHDRLKAFACPEQRGAFSRLMDAARERARTLGVGFRCYPLDPEEVAVCEADPLRILVVSSDGWVAPCVYLALPGQAAVPRCYEGHPVEAPRARFGNALEQDLMDIWESPAYRAFRRRFEARAQAAAVRAVTAVMSGGEGAPQTMPPPPEPCRTCYKLYGL